MSGKGNAEDAFWNISSLVPKKKRATLDSFIVPAPLHDVEVIGAKEADDDTRRLHSGPPQTKCETYTVSDNPFLSSVTLTEKRAGYNFYFRFLADARELFDLTGQEGASYTPFFSYMPQYSQLTGAQLAYYLYFRDRVRHGEYPKTDEGYFYLLVYELINLAGERIETREALGMLTDLWRSYAGTLPKINKYMAEWIADFCMIHRLPCPGSAISDLYPVIFQSTRFREFYLGGLSEITAENADLLLALMSDYDWRTSRYASGDTHDAFRRHIPHSLFEMLRALFLEGGVCFRQEGEEHMERSAFCGALWAHESRAAISVSYHPFSEASDLRDTVTAAVKYSENVLRAKLGMKSRLTAPAFPEEYRRMIDAYYRVMFRDEGKRKKETLRPAYEALYDAADSGVDFSRADEIEALSWSTTKLLVPEEEADAVPPPEPDPTPESGLGREAFDYLVCIAYDRPTGVSGVEADDLAGQINDAFSRGEIGDIVLEMSENGYSLIDDYSEEVKIWISKQGK